MGEFQFSSVPRRGDELFDASSNERWIFYKLHSKMLDTEDGGLREFRGAYYHAPDVSVTADSARVLCEWSSISEVRQWRLDFLGRTTDLANYDPIPLNERGDFIAVKDRFVYLGIGKHEDCNHDHAVAARIGKAHRIWGASSFVLRAKFATKRTRALVYVATVLSVLLHGAESWHVSHQIISSLETFHNRCCRIMCRLSRWQIRKHSISSESILRLLGLQPIEYYLYRRQLHWLGKVARMPSNRLPRRMLYASVRPSDAKHRPPGHPKPTLASSFDMGLKWANIDPGTWTSVAQDKDVWNATVNSVRPLKPTNFKPNLDRAARVKSTPKIAPSGPSKAKSTAANSAISALLDSANANAEASSPLRRRSSRLRDRPRPNYRT